jgi:CubicO group peptidase (beta-lactamase class C family)
MLLRKLAMAALLAGLQWFAGYGAAVAADNDGTQQVPWPTKSWQVSSPEEQGMDSASLARLIETVGTYRQDSLMIIRHGKIVAEAYYAPYVAGISHDLRSVTKSIVGTLTAIQLQTGSLDSVDHPVMDLFVDKQIQNIDDRKKAMTVQSLLDMTSGIEWVEKAYTPDESIMKMYESPDRTAFVLNQPMAGVPGSSFNYNGGNPYLLSALINKKSGKNAFDFAKKELFEPLGIKSAKWVLSMHRASPTAKPDFSFRLMTWLKLATSTFTTENGMEGRSSRRHGSTGPRPEALRQRSASTMQTCGGRIPKRASIWRAAVIRS